MNPVLCYDIIVKRTYQKPDFKSKRVKILPFATSYKISSILGKG